MQSASSRIWTRVAVSISYNDNDYTTGTSKFLLHLSQGEDYVHGSSVFTEPTLSCQFEIFH